MESIIPLDQLGKLCRYLEAYDKDIVLVGGAFDILHPGHLAFLEKAKSHGDVLMILLESDEKIKRFKGADRPVHSQKERAKMLSSLRFVDHVILLPDMQTDTDYAHIVETVRPTIIAVTDNDPHMAKKKNQAAQVGAKVIAVLPYLLDTSTSKIVEKLQKED